MKKEDLYDEIGRIDDDLIEEAFHIKKSYRNSRFIRIGAAAALLAILAGVGIPMLNKFPGEDNPQAINTPQAKETTQNPIGSADSIPSVAKTPDLTHLSGGVTARYIEEAPSANATYDLAELSLEEIFQEMNLAMFKGTVQKIRNIEIDFNEIQEYMAIATIQVETTYRGTMKPGDSINILLPCAINNDTWKEDCGVISTLEENMTGIFMPYIYDNTSTMEMNGVTFHLKEIADYGLGDGERFAFLDTKEGLVYYKYTYLDIKKSYSLDQVGEYIKKMIK